MIEITRLSKINMDCPGEWEGQLANGKFIHIEEKSSGIYESHFHPTNSNTCLNVYELAYETQDIFDFSGCVDVGNIHTRGLIL